LRADELLEWEDPFNEKTRDSSIMRFANFREIRLMSALESGGEGEGEGSSENILKIHRKRIFRQRVARCALLLSLEALLSRMREIKDLFRARDY